VDPPRQIPRGGSALSERHFLRSTTPKVDIVPVIPLGKLTFGDWSYRLRVIQTLAWQEYFEALRSLVPAGEAQDLMDHMFSLDENATSMHEVFTHSGHYEEPQQRIFGVT
jgi:hypothetical protein